MSSIGGCKIGTASSRCDDNGGQVVMYFMADSEVTMNFTKTILRLEIMYLP